MTSNAISTKKSNHEIIVSLKQYFALHLPDLTLEQLDVATNVSNALREEKFDKIFELFKDYEEQYKDSVLSLCARYLVFNDIPTTYRVNSFLNDYLLRLRFYASLKNDTAISISDLNILIDYIKGETDIIANWDGKTNLILLYHIKQILLNANELMYDDKFKLFPRKQFVFYLQQYVRYFEVDDENRAFLVMFIDLKNLKLVVRLFLTLLENFTSPEQLETIIKNNIEAFNQLQYDYEHIRDMYILNRMLKYAMMWKQQPIKNKNTLSSLRVLQVFGELLKDTDNTPNLSARLKNTIVDNIKQNQLTELIQIRNKLSHFKGLPFVYMHDINMIHDNINNLSIFIAELISYRKTKSNIFAENEEISFSECDFSLDIEIKENNSSMQRALNNLINSNNNLGMELIVMINIENLKKKRIKNNFGWMKDKYPTLSGTQLRNHLAHGDPIVELLQIDEAMTIKIVAKLLLEDIDSGKKEFIQKITHILKIDRQIQINKIEIGSIIKKQEILHLLIEGDLSELKKQLQFVSPDWINWCNERGENILQLASKNRKNNLQLFEFVFKANPDLLKIGEKTRMPLALALSNENQDIAEFLLERHLETLLNNKTNYNKVDYTKELNTMLEIYQKDPDKLTSNNWFILCCFGILIDNVKFLKLLSQTIYWISIDDIFKTYNLSFLEIQSLFGAQLESQFFDYKITKQIRVVERTEMMKLLQSEIQELEHSRLITGENALHVAVKHYNVKLIESIFNEFPQFILLTDNEFQTPVDIAFNMNNRRILTKILQLVLEYCTDKLEIYKNVFYRYMCENRFKLQDVLNCIAKNVYSDNKMVQYWKLKVYTSFTYRIQSQIDLEHESETEFTKQLQKIIDTYSSDGQIMIECEKLILNCILYEKRKLNENGDNILQVYIKVLESIPKTNIILFTEIENRINCLENEEYEHEYWSIALKDFTEIESESPDIHLLKIKIIFFGNMLTTISNWKNILDGLEIVAKHPSFNNLDDDSYYIWVDVFVTATAMLHLNSNDDNKKKLPLENALKEWKVNHELEQKLLELHTQNYKFQLTTGNKDEIKALIKNKEYMWKQIQLKNFLQYVLINKNINWEEIKCVLNSYDDDSLNLKHFLSKYTSEITDYIESCLSNNSQLIIENLLEYNITELVDLLMTMSISFELHTSSYIWHIIFYIIHSNNLIVFNKIYNIMYSAESESKQKEVLITAPLHFACQYGALQTVDFLICSGLDLNSSDHDERSPLYLAVHYQHEEIKQLLINQGATDRYLEIKSNDSDNHHKLHEIIQSGQVEDLKKFLDEKQEIEWRSSMETGDTCLHYAIQSGNVAMIEEVYSKCAHLSITTNYNKKSPLDIAIQSSDTVIKTFITLVLNNIPSRVIIFKKCIDKITSEIKNIPEAVIKCLLDKVILVLSSQSNDKIFNYWLTSTLRVIFENHYKHIGNDETLMSNVVNLFTNQITKFFNEHLILIKYVRLFPLICLGSIKHTKNQEKLSKISNCVLQKIEDPIIAKNMLNAIHLIVKELDSTQPIFTKCAVCAMIKFPNNREIQEDALYLIYYAYKNGQEPDMPKRNRDQKIQNLIQSGSWNKRNTEVKAIVFTYYFIWHHKIEPTNIDNVIDDKLNRFKWENLEGFNKHVRDWNNANDDENKTLAKNYFRNEIINVLTH